jgi:hypothetical protein
MHDLPFEMVDVVEEVFRSAVKNVRVLRVERPPIIFNQMDGVAFGRRWRILGHLNGDGEWEVIDQVAPMGEA